MGAPTWPPYPPTLGAPRQSRGAPRPSWVLAGLLLVAAIVPAAAHADSGALRVVTFNLLHGGPWSEWTGDDQQLEQRFEMAVAELETLKPDIVALQEASIGRRRGNVAARLAERLGMRYVHVRATDRVFS